LSEKAVELKNTIRKISEFSTDEYVENTRRTKEQQFLKYFQSCLSKLNLPNFNEPRYTQLYSISSFPYQGVELHKTVIAYHFALNKVIATTHGIHRFPFILDAVMKEDIDEDNRRKIFGFLNEFSPTDTQMIFSVSESLSDSKDDDTTTINIDLVNKHYFSDKGKVIQIGDGDSERTFLVPYDGEHIDLIQATLDLTNIA
jgi:hypothetical protein